MNTRLLLSLPLLLSACALRRGETPQAFAPPMSQYSASFDPSTSAPVVAPARPIQADLIVPPDLLSVTFAVTAKGADKDAALAAIKAEVERIGKHAQQAGGEQAQIKLCGFRLEQQGDNVHAIADGAIEIGLLAQDDYWRRAAILAALAHKTEEADQASEIKVQVGYGEPALSVKDPERYRDELNKRWIDKVRAFSTAAEQAHSPLRIAHCEPPQAIGQSTISLQEVALSLRLACQLDAPDAGPQR